MHAAKKIGKAFILAGGKGERLMPLTKDTPKVMVEVKGKPILEYNVELAKRFGAKEVVLGVGHLHEKIRDYFGTGKKFGVKIVYSVEKEFFGTGGALKLAQGFFDSDFLMMNGDELKDFNPEPILKTHFAEGAVATLALKEIHDASEFGAVRLEGGRITSFDEKNAVTKNATVSAGLYILGPEIFNYLPDGKSSIERDAFPKIAAKGKLFGVLCQGQWLPTDNLARLEKARKDWQGKQK
ncbi:MAG: nucleotidyltransferase family protein [Candidatus Diapherotrites archaeon]|nr:nucleotidyltransferase family protein [Candidatus Diapherotrites archaeon]